MANSFSALAPVNFMPKVQDFLNKMLIAEEISRTEFRAQLRSGQTIDWPYITDMRVQTYTPGTDLTIDDCTATSDTMTINISRAVTFSLDPNAEAQAEDKTVNALMARQAAHQLSSYIDQGLLQVGISNANNTHAAGTLTASNIYTMLTTVMATLDRDNATDGPVYAVLDPERVALLAQAEVANGWNVADSALKNGFVGPSQAGFKIYKSNNLPTSCSFTMDTQPTATDTVTIAGVTWTWVASGAVAADRQISIGANNAAAQTNLRNAINNTGTPGADTYQLGTGTSHRRRYQNAQVSMATWAANVAVITAYGRQSNSETFTAATNVFGTETGNMLAGAFGATSLGMQIMPNMVITQEPKRPEKNYLLHTLYGTKVFHRDTDRLVNITINV